MPATPTELLLALFFIVPGFVTRTVISANIRRNKQDPQEWLLEVLLYGAVNFAFVLIVYALAVTVHLIQSNEFSSFPPSANTALIIAFAGVIFLVMTPTLLGAVILPILPRVNFLLGLLSVRLASDEPTAWDAFFKKRQQCWVVVTFKDGSRAGGFMGLNSGAASSDDGQDIYLEKSYTVTADGALSPEPVPNY